MTVELDDLQFLIRQLRNERDELKNQLQDIRNILRRHRLTRVRSRRTRNINPYEYPPYLRSAAGDYIPNQSHMETNNALDILEEIRRILR